MNDDKWDHADSWDTWLDKGRKRLEEAQRQRMEAYKSAERMLTEELAKNLNEEIDAEVHDWIKHRRKHGLRSIDDPWEPAW